MTATYRRVSGLTGRPQRLLWDTIPGPTKPPTKTPKPFTPKHGQPGSVVRWTEYPYTDREHEGVVWSLADRGVWAVWDDGLSGVTLVNVTVNGDGRPGKLLRQVTYGGQVPMVATAADPDQGCDFGECGRTVTHIFHNGPEPRPVCETHGHLLEQLQSFGHLTEYAA